MSLLTFLCAMVRVSCRQSVIWTKCRWVKCRGSLAGCNFDTKMKLVVVSEKKEIILLIMEQIFQVFLLLPKVTSSSLSSSLSTSSQLTLNLLQQVASKND